MRGTGKPPRYYRDMASAIRVLRVATRLNVGGPTRHISMLMRGMDPSLCAQQLVSGPCPAAEGKGVLATPPSAFIVPQLCREISPWNDWRALGAMRALAKKHDPQIIHSHMAKAGLLARLVARGDSRYRAVHTLHGHTFDSYFRAGSGRVLAWMESWLALHSAALIVQSPGQRDSVCAHISKRAAARLHVIPPAVQTEFLERPTLRDAALAMSLGVREGVATVLFPARLVEVKQPLLALAVLEELLKLRRVLLLVPGDGPLKSKFLARVQQRGLGAAVKVVPFVAELWRLYDCADATLLLSRSEGTPLVILESHARTVPVAAPDVGAVRELLHREDLLLPRALTPAAIAASLHEFLSCRRSGDASAAEARERVRKENAEALLCSRVLGLYRSLL